MAEITCSCLASGTAVGICMAGAHVAFSWFAGLALCSSMLHQSELSLHRQVICGDGDVKPLYYVTLMAEGMPASFYMHLRCAKCLASAVLSAANPQWQGQVVLGAWFTCRQCCSQHVACGPC
jgi:hypothetical protein